MEVNIKSGGRLHPASVRLPDAPKHFIPAVDHPRSSISLHGKATVLPSRALTSANAPQTARLHSFHFAVTTCFLTPFPVMQALRL
ncbi:MAG: hypothetical protein IJ920_00610 [Paludibacteraceae bacterium]|nr:hypothetical protein [Paludibacteraceae bacterium]